MKNIVQRMAFPELNFGVQEVQSLHIDMKDANVKDPRLSKFNVQNSDFKVC